MSAFWTQLYRGLWPWIPGVLRRPSRPTVEHEVPQEVRVVRVRPDIPAPRIELAPVREDALATESR